MNTHKIMYILLQCIRIYTHKNNDLVRDVVMCYIIQYDDSTQQRSELNYGDIYILLSRLVAKIKKMIIILYCRLDCCS